MSNVSKAENKIINLCRKYRVVIDYNIYFPYMPKDQPHPAEVQEAMKVLMKHGMKILFVLKDAMEAVSKSVKRDKK